MLLARPARIIPFGFGFDATLSALLASPVHPNRDGRDALPSLRADKVVNRVRLGRELFRAELQAFEKPHSAFLPRGRADQFFADPGSGDCAVDVLHRSDAHGVAVHDVRIPEPAGGRHLPVEPVVEERIGVGGGLLLPLVPQLVDVGVMEQELGGICRGERRLA